MRSILCMVVLWAAAWGASGMALGAERGSTTDAVQGSATMGSGDAEIARLLKMEVAEPGERLEYARQCERAAAQYPQANRKADLYQRIGDTYFCLNRFSSMKRWYHRALSADPSMETRTSIGFRLREYGKVKLGRFARLASLVVLGCIFCLLLFHAMRNRRLFDWRFFVRKGMAFLVLYSLVAWALLWADGRAAARWLLNLSTPEAGRLAIIKPVIPLSMVDASRATRAVMILAYGFLPVLVGVFYTSFRRRWSRLFLGTLVLLSIVSLWTHFYFTQVFDPVRSGDGFVRNGRVYLRDEPEELLARDPQKALRANPELLKGDNDDLKEFMKEHFPDGVK